MSALTVCKFGGSSVRDASAMRRCSRILEKYTDIKLVIISATYNTTNELEEFAGLSLKDISEALGFMGKTWKRHRDLALKLECSPLCFRMLDELEVEAEGLAKKMNSVGHYDKEIMDQIYSLGERLSSAIFADYLNQYFQEQISYFDVRSVLQTDETFGRAKPDIAKIKFSVEQNLKPEMLESRIIVTQGFVGSSPDGKTTTLGREGSDYSAALLGEALDASLIQIWTDVPGIATADPRKISNARFIKELTFEEASVLARNGAKVLFPETLEPAKRIDCPVYVGSSLDLDTKGTLICCTQNENRISGMATEFNRITVSGIGVSFQEDKILSFLEEYSPKVVNSSEHELTMQFEESQTIVISRLLHAYLFEE
jgi:aspartate kinase